MMTIQKKINNIVDGFTEIPEYLLWQFPGYLMVKDTKSQYLASNKNFAQLWGFHSIDEVIGIYDDDLKCEAAKGAETFRQQDHQAQKKNLKILDIYRYADGNVWALLVDKRAIYDKNKNFMGVVSQVFPLNRQLMQRASVVLEGNLTKQNGTSYLLNQPPFSVGLTHRESECLYYLLRGKTAKQTGILLGLSPRTVENHNNAIKCKFNTQNKAELIEKAIHLGLFYYIPESLLIPGFSCPIEIGE